MEQPCDHQLRAARRRHERSAGGRGVEGDSQAGLARAALGADVDVGARGALRAQARRAAVAGAALRMSRAAVLRSRRLAQPGSGDRGVLLTEHVHGVRSPSPSTEKPFARRSMELRVVGMMSPACAAAPAKSAPSERQRIAIADGPLVSAPSN